MSNYFPADLDARLTNASLFIPICLRVCVFVYTTNGRSMAIIPSGIFSSEFNEQISDLLSKLLSLTGKHIILGDFNFRIIDPTDTHAAKFNALTEQFN